MSRLAIEQATVPTPEVRELGCNTPFAGGSPK